MAGMNSAQPEPHDPRIAAMNQVRDLLDLLCGDLVLAPFKDGKPDWPNITRASLEKIQPYPGEIQPEDIPRLGILTDSFDRFCDAPMASAASVLTLWRQGTPDTRQLPGVPCPAAVELIVDAISERTPLTELPFAEGPRPNWLPSFPRLPSLLAPANDNASDGLPIVDPACWEGKPIPDRLWFLPGLIPGRTVTLLSGDGGTGKSLAALQLAVASVLDCETAGLSPASGRVLYVGAEDEADEFQRRLADILLSMAARFQDLGGDLLILPLASQDATLAAPGRTRQMEPTPLFTKLIDRIASFKPGLVVLDTSADLFGGDEISRVQVRQFVGMLRTIAIEMDCAVLLLSHPSLTGMQSGAGTSGSTAWNNSVRSRLYLTAPEGGKDEPADPDARLLTSMKSNYGRKGDAIKLRWCDGVFVRDEGPHANLAAKARGEKAESVFVELLRKFIRLGQNVSDVSGTNYAPAKMAKHPDARGIGVTRSALAQAMQRLLEDGTIKIAVDGPPSRRRKRLIVSADDFGPDRQAA